MKKKRIHYEQEKEIFPAYGMNPIPGSGAFWQKGSEDGESENWKGQAKTTGGPRISIWLRDIYSLLVHAHPRSPMFVLRFLKQDLVLPEGTTTLEQQEWVLIPKDVFLSMRDTFEKNFFERD